MIYKTLHWYIFRELLRIFALTASALTTLLAFGGTFKPLTKGGLDVWQLMLVLLNLMPAMLAYAIPLAALFAAVLVYWRVSTDNELTACRASGISFGAMLLPALALGLVVASVDLVFVNHIVPYFLQRSEHVVWNDLGSVLIHKVGRQEAFQYGKIVVYAESGQQEDVSHEQIPVGIDRRTVVRLNNMAALYLGKDNKQPTLIVVARGANVIIDELAHKEEVHMLVQLEDGAAFDPFTFRRMSGTMRSLPPDGTPFIMPSALKDRPKFLNFFELNHLKRSPDAYTPVGDSVEAVKRAWTSQQIAGKLKAQWSPGKPMVFEQAGGDSVRVIAPAADLGIEKALAFGGNAEGPVRVEQYTGGRLVYYYTAGLVDLALNQEDPGIGLPRLIGELRLHENVMRKDVQRQTPLTAAEKLVVIRPLEIPAALVTSLPAFPVTDLKAHTMQFTPDVGRLANDMYEKIARLQLAIGSEMYSRASFALSCLTLVLLGAALGVMMRGRNPLLVFVVGFVPAIVLVLLITAGRQMVEHSDGPGVGALGGFSVIWAGNGILALMVLVVYGKLLRR